MLTLDQQTWRTTRTYHVGNNDVSRITFEDTDTKSETLGETIKTSQEYWLRDKKTEGGTSSDKRPTNMKCDVEDVRTGVGRIGKAGFGAIHEDVKTVVLSEAQYLRNEDVPDVLGYSLYNAMPGRKIREPVYERVGLCQVYKRKWKDLSPRKQTS